MEWQQANTKYRALFSRGIPCDILIGMLRDDGVSVVTAIRVAKEGLGLPLSEAKRVVSSHPAWTDIVKANEPFHDELERIARTFQDEASGERGTM